jgi:predicted MFS family arabinose efflux permease
VTVFLVASGFGSLGLGYALSRWSVRGTSIAFIIIFVAAIAAVGLMPASPTLMYADFALIGFFGTAASGLPYSVAICGWFDRHRGLALGIAVAGGGLGALLAPQYATYLLQELGWRHSFFVLAATIGVVSLFGLIFLVRDPPPTRVEKGRDAPASMDTAYLRRRAFWLLILVFLGLSVATWGVLPNIFPMLTDQGVSPSRAAAVMSTAGFASWGGRLAVGYLMDRVFAPWVAAGILLLTTVSLALLARGGAIQNAYIGASLIGVAVGSEADMLTYLISRYFSQAEFSRVAGALWVIWCWGGGIGTYLAGVTYQSSNSYLIALWVFGVALVLSAAISLLLGPYVYPPKHRTFEPLAQT